MKFNVLESLQSIKFENRGLFKRIEVIEKVMINKQNEDMKRRETDPYIKLILISTATS
jgi:hypothetical protein